ADRCSGGKEAASAAEKGEQRGVDDAGGRRRTTGLAALAIAELSADVPGRVGKPIVEAGRCFPADLRGEAEIVRNDSTKSESEDAEPAEVRQGPGLRNRVAAAPDRAAFGPDLELSGGFDRSSFVCKWKVSSHRVKDRRFGAFRRRRSGSGAA